MNISLNDENIIKANIAAGVDDVTLVGQLISMGMDVGAAQQKLNEVKKFLDSQIDPITLLPENWLVWLQENIQRKCDPNELAKTVNKDLGIDLNKCNEIIRKISDKDYVSPIIMEGGFEYEDPIVKIEGNTIDADGQLVRVVLTNNKPPIIVFENVLSDEECEQLIEHSRSKVKKSAVVDNETGADVFNQHRKSFGTFFMNSENELIQTIEQRIAKLMNQPVENGEGFQVLNYQIGGEYKPHFDYFDPTQKGSRKHLTNGGQRVATMVIYLNDVEAGGQTSFPEIGLTVSPKKGSAVYFEYCNSKGQLDKKSLHAGCPVERGEKWIMTKWVRQYKFG